MNAAHHSYRMSSHQDRAVRGRAGEAATRVIELNQPGVDGTAEHLRRARRRVADARRQLEAIQQGAAEALMGVARAHERTAEAMERHAARRPEKADLYTERAAYHRIQATIARTLALPEPGEG
ncbi:hypothetical protein J4573_31405 [Actinomadura barringtoniae]|uniref:Uncharacterized protein n=1 Tax=Actinomadura barringtoniae TaxID=1427535 RepID=A0A939PKP2_9ACTN|nr:hypothetical protein [Actinomadura barringtoniae]MBO2451634.1 hypothetical protein [Actinomadura barringtoniae]